VYGCAVTGDGKTVVAGGHDGVLRSWNADTAAEIRNFPPPTEAVNPQAAK
jgi:WD40 repeat protein